MGRIYGLRHMVGIFRISSGHGRPITPFKAGEQAEANHQAVDLHRAISSESEGAFRALAAARSVNCPLPQFADIPAVVDYDISRAYLEGFEKSLSILQIGDLFEDNRRKTKTVIV
jgi:hypothetical protein